MCNLAAEKVELQLVLNFSPREKSTQVWIGLQSFLSDNINCGNIPPDIESKNRDLTAILKSEHLSSYLSPRSTITSRYFLSFLLTPRDLGTP